MELFEVFWETKSFFVTATWLTIRVTATSLIIGVFIGLIFAFFKISSSRLLNGIANVYITIIRGTPLIVQIFVLYYGIYKLVALSGFWAGALGLAIHNGAYITEIFRGTIQSIDKGQMEAARSLGMSYFLAMRRIILPQAFKRAIPPLGNQFIIGLKDSSLVAYIGMNEIWGTALSEAAASLKMLSTYAVAGFYYLVIVMIFSYLVSRLEKRLDVEKSRG
ncbi:MAG: amino acid ABC transporter permease [Bacillaceae bacterium]|nr:amino acid ABC transporter permease [Bacillaceae bacterium]